MRTLTEVRRTARKALLAGAAAAAMVATALVVGLTTPAYACSCVQIDLQTQAKQGDAVFVGTPVDVTESGNSAVYEVRVSDVYAGTADPTTTVRTAADGASCGVDLKLDRQYMFVGDQKQPHGEVSTTMCSGTQPISDQAILDVEKALGPATPYRDTSGTGGRDQAGDDKADAASGDDKDTTASEGGTNGESTGTDGGSSGTAEPGDAQQASDSSDDGGSSTTYAVVGVALALAVGASFALPQLRRRKRSQ
ncbi:hypothetical protein [Solicola gregarius]|uniref:Tissue inhibitor of metalloproteinase n=1 Tax=Solicola gregarius TaxID=2908642 RepID=A0AA46THE9_9ACTN|nr:hypothetical protein [Solicola gregarius]UYM04877.1 hypothetical protein L0C25_20480 [Solicola gregarius]